MPEMKSTMPRLPPAKKLGQGYVFTCVCDSVYEGGGSAPLHAGIHPPPTRGRHTHPRNGGRHPPQHSACWEIRPTSGRYASYWNAILLCFVLLFSEIRIICTNQWNPGHVTKRTLSAFHGVELPMLRRTHLHPECNYCT